MSAPAPVLDLESQTPPTPTHRPGALLRRLRQVQNAETPLLGSDANAGVEGDQVNSLRDVAPFASQARLGGGGADFQNTPDRLAAMDVYHRADKHASRWEPKLRSEWNQFYVARAFGLFVGIVVFWVCFTLISAVPGWQKQCPNGPNGQLCNGQGYCGDFGECVCTNALFSGQNCGVTPTAIAYDPNTDTFCNGRGVPNPMTFDEVYDECLYLPATPGDAHPTQRGWLYPACVSRLNAKYAQLSRAWGNVDAVLAVRNLGGVPICQCTGMWTGAACEFTGCPFLIGGAVCAGNGNKTVGLFYNGSYDEANTGCQCLNPFSLMQPATLALFSDNLKRVIASNQQYLDFFNQPQCGQLVVSGNALFLMKGKLSEDGLSTTAFACRCDGEHFGVACQRGKCPEYVVNGVKTICAGNGHHDVGFGRELNVSTCVGNCEVVCAPGYSVCKPPGVYNGRGTTCASPNHPDQYEFSAACAVARATFSQCTSGGAAPCPTVGPEQCPSARPWRCADGTCVASSAAASPIAPNAPGGTCSLGFTTATLDWPFYDQVRASKRCDFASRSVSFADCLARVLPNTFVFDDNQTDLAVDDDGTVTASRIVFRPPTQLVWFLLEVAPVSAASGLNVTSSVAFLGRQQTFAPISASAGSATTGTRTATTITTIAYAPQTNYTLPGFDAQSYADASASAAPTTLTMRAVNSGTSPGAIASSVVVFPVPFWGAQQAGEAAGSNTAPVPDVWRRFRLRNTRDGTFVVCDTLGYVAEFEDFGAPASAFAPVPFTNVTVLFLSGLGPNKAVTSALATTGLAPFTNAVQLDTCMSALDVCTFFWNSTSSTMFSLNQNVYACFDLPDSSALTSGWRVQRSACTVNATRAFSSSLFFVRTARYALTAANLAPVAQSRAAFDPGTWAVQFVVDPLSLDVVWSAVAPVRIVSIEALAFADITLPCTCPVTVFLTNTNVSTQNMQFGSNADLGRSAFAPGDHVVAPFTQSGIFHYQRGIVLGASEIRGLNGSITTVQVSGGYGVLALPTTSLRFLSRSQFLGGLADDPLAVRAARCPIGYDAAVVVRNVDVDERDCVCDVTSVGASCACASGLTCACAVAIDLTQGSDVVCECDALASAQFAATIAEHVKNATTACACAFSPPPPPSAQPLSNVTLVVPSAANSSFLTITIAPQPPTGYIPEVQRFVFTGDAQAGCAVPSVVATANVSSYAYTTPITLAVSPCVDDVVEAVLNTTQEHTWTSFTFSFGAAWSGTIVAELSPPGFALRSNVAYSASSNNATASDAADFSMTWWSSSLNLPETPVWLRMSFTDEPKSVARVFVDMRASALAMRSADNSTLIGVVPVLIRLQVLADPLGGWTTAGSFLSDAFGSNDDERVVVAFDPALPPVRAVRLLSPYPMSVRTFTAFSDQVCACAQTQTLATAANATVVLVPAAKDMTAAVVPPIPLLDAQSVLDTVVARSKLMNLSVEARATCVYRDLCILDIDGAVYDASDRGTCNDLVYFNKKHDVTFETVTVTTNSSVLPPVWFQVYFGYVQPDATFSVFSIPASMNNLTLPPQPTNLTVVVVWSPTNSTLTPTQPYVTANFYAQYAQFLAFGVRASIPASVHTVWFFLDPATNVEVDTGAVFNLATGQWSLVSSSSSVVASAVPPIGSVCAPGMDGSDCGASTRYDLESPGLTCDLAPYAQQAYDDYVARNGSLPDSQRTVGEIVASNPGVVVVRLGLPPIRRVVSMPVSDCASAVCYPPTQRCENGRCAVNGECGNRWNNPGNGCDETGVNVLQFTCACQRGFDGDACEYGKAVPATPYIKPYTDARPGNWLMSVPPLRGQPPFATTVNSYIPYGPADVIRMNRARVAWTNVTAQLAMVGVQNRFAPWGPKFTTQRLVAGVLAQSSCGYAAKGPLGQYILFTDAVNRDPFTNDITGWACWPAADGTCETIVFANETAYDDFPLPIANGFCVADSSEAALSNLLYAPCNGHGTKRSDGTCDCAAPWTSFILTEAFTCRATTPYAVDPATCETIPNTWFAPPNNNWRDFLYGLCIKRDCTAVDCGPPKACFPGTPEQNFKDKLIECPPSGSGGIVTRTNRCAASVDECAKGNTVPMPNCGNKGITYLIDYTSPPEWACACGDPISTTANISDITNPSELLSNGFGGRACDQYYCSSPASQQLVWSERDPRTGSAYYDLGVPIPGEWIAFCGKPSDPTSPIVPVGPDPAEAPLWAECCPGENRLKRCANIPCTLAGTVQCVSSRTCATNGGTPHVYVCNNHGVDRMDGTCGCDNDGVSQGYAPDYSRFETDNCYLKINCPLSQINGLGCNYKTGCSEPEAWVDVPDDKSFELQNEVMLALMGYGVDNATYINVVLPILNSVTGALQAALARAALVYEVALGGLGGCVCVYPGENPASPCCMLPYAGSTATIGYRYTFASPWRFEDVVWNATLGSGYDPVVITAQLNGFDMRVYTPLYVQLDSSTRLEAQWGAVRTFTQLRIYARACDALGVCYPPSRATLDILDVNTLLPVCPSLKLDQGGTDSSEWAIYDIYCIPIYSQLDYAAFSPIGYLQNCGSGITASAVSAGCTAWKQSSCSSVSGAIWIPAGSLTTLRGCAPPAFLGGEACCVPTVPLSPSSVSAFVLRAASVPIQIQIAKVFGYQRTSLAVSSSSTWLYKQLVLRSTTPGCANTPDQKFMQEFLGSDKQLYLPGDDVPSNANKFLVLEGTQQPALSYGDANALCLTTGGWLAVINGITETGSDVSQESKNMAAAVRSHRGASYPAVIVALRNVFRKLLYLVSDFFSLPCRSVGCRFVTPSTFEAGGARFPYAYYSAPRRTDYLSKWDSAQLTGGWPAFFRSMGRLAPITADVDLGADLVPSAVFAQAVYACRRILAENARIYVPLLPTPANDLPTFANIDMFPCLVATFGDTYGYADAVFGRQVANKAASTDQWASTTPNFCKIEVFEGTKCNGAGSYGGTRAQSYSFEWSWNNNVLGNAADVRGGALNEPVPNYQFFKGAPFTPKYWSDGTPVTGELVAVFDNTIVYWNVPPGMHDNIKSFRITGANCVVNVQGVSGLAIPDAGSYQTQFSVNYLTGPVFGQQLVVSGGPGYAFPPYVTSRSDALYPQNLANVDLNPYDDSCVSVTDIYNVFPDTRFSAGNAQSTALAFTFMPPAPWYSATVQVEAEASPPPPSQLTNLLDANTTRAETLGFLSHPYMCMGLEMLVSRAMHYPVFTQLPPFFSLLSNIFNYAGTQAVHAWQLTSFGAGRVGVGFGNDDFAGSQVGGWCYPGVWFPPGAVNPARLPLTSNHNLTTCALGFMPLTPITSADGSPQLAVCASRVRTIDPVTDWVGAPTPAIPGSIYSYTPQPTWYPIPECDSCPFTFSTQFYWDANVGPRSGDQLPTIQTTAVGVEIDPATGTRDVVDVATLNDGRLTQLPVLLRFDNPNIGIVTPPGDGLVYLYQLGRAGNPETWWRYYANQMVTQRDDLFDTQWVVSDCAIVSAMSDLFGFIIAYPCTRPMQYLCQLDYTKLTAQNGMVCDECTNSAAVGGFARPVNTSSCYAEYASELTAYNQRAYEAQQNGTLALIAGTNPQDWNTTREYLLNQSIYLWPAIPTMREKFNQGLSTQLGSLSPGAVANTFLPLNLELPPIECGVVVPKATAIPERLCAYDQAACNPNAVIGDQNTLPLSQLAPGLLGVTLSPAEARQQPRCGALWRPVDQITWTQGGAPPPNIDLELTIIGSNELGAVTYTALSNVTHVFNTGRTTTRYVFTAGVDVWISGTITVQCDDGGCAPNVTVWLSEMSPTMELPPVRSQFRVGSFLVPPNVDNVPFSVHTVPDFQYLVLGFDVTAPPQSVVTFNPVVISDNGTLAACGVTQALLPKLAPKRAIKSNAPYNHCILTEKDMRLYGATQLGQCFCGAPTTGQACDAPAVVTPYGKLVYNGIDGLAQAPNGLVVRTTTDPSGEMGMYCYTTDFFGSPTTQCSVKTRRLGLIMWTTLLELGSDYGRVFRYDSLQGQIPYVYVDPSEFAPLTYVDDATAIALAAAHGALLASYVNQVELLEVVALIEEYPIFLDLAQNAFEPGTGSLTGVSDNSWYWVSRGVQFGPTCIDAPSCGVLMPSEVACVNGSSPYAGVWTEEACEAINVQNRAFHQTGLGDTDGSYTPAVCGLTRTTLTNAPAIGSTAYVWVTNPLSAPSPVTSAQCTIGTTTSVLGSSPATWLVRFACASAGSPYTVQLNYASGVCVREVQMYPLGYGTLMPFYPYPT